MLDRPAARPWRGRLRAAARHPDLAVRSVVRRMRRRFKRPTYDGAYFSASARPVELEGLSGYEYYDRQISNADIHAYLIWRTFDAGRTLEVGAALGYLVEALRELGVEADGLDISDYAVEHAAPGARGHLRQADLLAGLPVADAEYDAVIAIETLEHLPPKAVPNALKEVARATRGWVLATIPSFGPNAHGPDGFFDGKVLWDRLDVYKALAPSYQGPVPHRDLMVDAQGEPIQGHLTIASFSWWTDRFADVGLERCGEMEARIHEDLAWFGLTNAFDPYVFRVPGTPLPTHPLRTYDELRELRERWQLEERRRITG